MAQATTTSDLDAIEEEIRSLAGCPPSDFVARLDGVLDRLPASSPPEQVARHISVLIEIAGRFQRLLINFLQAERLRTMRLPSSSIAESVSQVDSASEHWNALQELSGRINSLLDKAERRQKDGGRYAGLTVTVRLRHLKELFAEGLITADDYARRRHAILAEV